MADEPETFAPLERAVQEGINALLAETRRVAFQSGLDVGTAHLDGLLIAFADEADQMIAKAERQHGHGMPPAFPAWQTIYDRGVMLRNQRQEGKACAT